VNLLAFLFAPILQSLNRIEDALLTLDTKVSQLMTQVQISQESLDQYAQAVSDVADEIGSDIEALKEAAEAAGTPLPEANVTSLQASLEKLTALDQPDTEPVDPGNPSQAPTDDEPQVNPL
jgi:DNA anti-recombination protein RmuC